MNYVQNPKFVQGNTRNQNLKNVDGLSKTPILKKSKASAFNRSSIPDPSAFYN